MRTIAIRVLTVGAVASAGVAMMAAEPAPSRPMPPLPVPPVERGRLLQSMTPFLMRMTMTGDMPSNGPIEACVDPAATMRDAEARRARDPAPKSLAGCTHSSDFRPGGAMHFEMACDITKGATSSYHVVRDGTPSDMRTHMETYALDPKTGMSKTSVEDMRTQILGACPADLKPGQMRKPDGTIVTGPPPRDLMPDRDFRRDDVASR